MQGLLWIEGDGSWGGLWGGFWGGLWGYGSWGDGSWYGGSWYGICDGREGGEDVVGKRGDAVG